MTDQSKEITKASSLDEQIEYFKDQMTAVYDGNFNVMKANKVAAAVLNAQLDLAKILPDAEFRARNSKQEIKCVESEVAFELKEANQKLAEAAITRLIPKDPRIKEANMSASLAEKESKKWQHISNVLKEAHVFFRTLGKEI